MIGNYFWGGAAAPYAIEQSLRFNDDDSAYLQLNGGTSPTNGKIATHSVWVKRSLVASSDPTVFGSSPAGTLWNDIKFDGNDRLIYRQYHSSGGAALWALTTAARYRDPSAWLHIVVAIDTTQATAANRVKMYVNGTQITAWDQETYPGQNQVPLGQQGNYAVGIGRLTTTFNNYFDGHMAEYHHVDGTAHDPTDFGEYDANGVWRPIKVTGITYGNRGWYLTFDSGATNGIGHDHSGNGNHFTATGFTTSGTGTDVMSDTPTNNWCTLNPLDKNSNMTLNNGNLDTVGTNGIATATFGLSSGKWYWEATLTDPWYSSAFGVYYYGEHGLSKGGSSGSYDQGAKLYATQYGPSGGTYSNGSRVTAYTSYSTNDIIGFAFDADAMQLDIYRNNTKIGSTLTVPAGNIYPTVYNEGTGGDPGGSTYNFGQRAFAYTPPTGFKSLNSSNLPAPTVKDGSEYFNTLTYTGNGTGSFTGVGFQPDFTWIKCRNAAESHDLFDVVRGAPAYLQSNTTAAEQSYAGYALTSFDSDGFTLNDPGGGGYHVNKTGNTYVAWNWKANGSGSSNTAGSITSTVSANPSAGFSIVTYSGTGSGETVGHGLGVAPAFIITKSRNNSFDWGVLHHKAGTPGYSALLLNQTISLQTNNLYWNNTAPTSTTFSIGSTGSTGGANNNYIAYCFAEVEGYSKFGSYTGNGSTDGPFVQTGFSVSWLLVKRTDTIDGWFIVDNKRNTYNVRANYLNPHLSIQEYSNLNIADFLSNGFKVRESNNAVNASGGTYIFAAFAEHPFGGSGVSPATAR